MPAPAKCQNRIELPQETVVLRIAPALQRVRKHRSAIAQRVGGRSGEGLAVETDSLYPGPRGLELQKWGKSEWKLIESSPRAVRVVMEPEAQS